MNQKIKPAVVARKLVKKYGALTAVAGIDFEIIPGECFGFLGPNGAGKTTTVRMIYGMSPLTSGELKVLGFNINQDSRSIRAKIGVLPQETNLDMELNVLENLETYASYFDIPSSLARKRALKLLEFLDLKERAFSQIEELSSGMKRRLLLARALLNNPQLLILDEPTTGLDPQARNIIWQRLRDLKAKQVTQILTTHYMEEATELCDRVAIMDRGEIIALDSPQRIIAKEKCSNLEEVFLKLTGRKLKDGSD